MSAARILSALRTYERLQRERPEALAWARDLDAVEQAVGVDASRGQRSYAAVCADETRALDAEHDEASS